MKNAKNSAQRNFGKIKSVLTALSMFSVMFLYQNCSQFQAVDYSITSPLSSSLSVGGETRFNKASDVLRTNCVSCHQAGGTAAFAPLNFGSEAQFVNANLVKAGNVDGSKLLTRIIHYSGPTASTKNMPLGSGMAKTDYDALVSWVTMMGVPDQPPVTPPTEKTYFTCTAGADPSASPLQRLLKVELRNTLTELMLPLAAADKTAVNTELDNILKEFPDDQAKGFTRLANSISQPHVTTQYKIATKFAEMVTSVPARLNALNGAAACVTASPPTQACMITFIKNFGLKVYRRPLLDAEATALYNFFLLRGQTTGRADLIGLMMMSPEFLYHLENQGTSVDARTDLLRLTPYEVASKISYHFWNSMPNAELLAAAADGRLGTDAGVKTVLETVVFGTQLARTKQVIGSYFNEWLQIDQISPLTNKSPNFLAFAAGENLNVAGYNHRTDMINEVNDLINHYVWTEKSGYKELLTSDISFAKTDALANLYDVPKWTPGTANVRFPAGERSGLLTRAGMLVTGGVENNPIHNGVHVIRDILCNDLPPPPPDVVDTGNVVGGPILTTRDRVHNLTSGAACTSCHAVINPIGFAFEAYDALGRVRQGRRQNIYDETGKVIASLPVATEGMAQVNMGEPVQIQDAVDLSKKIAESGKGEACFAKTYYRYTFKKMENDKMDGCGLLNLYTKLQAKDGGMLAMFKEVTQQRAFLLRKVAK